MVEERAAERTLEEVVGDRVVGMTRLVEVRIDRQRGRVVNAHGQPNRVATGHVPVLCAAVQLVLLLIEAVDHVGRASARQS